MTTAKMTPHRCPVCEGRGQMPVSFYGGVVNDSGSTTPCRACDKGVVWAMVVATNVLEIRDERDGDDLTIPRSRRN